jgi:hypothetical protein
MPVVAEPLAQLLLRLKHLWRSQDARRLPIDGALYRNKVALRGSMGQRWGHVVSVARLKRRMCPSGSFMYLKSTSTNRLAVMLTSRQIDFKDSLETGQLRKQ